MTKDMKEYQVRLSVAKLESYIVKAENGEEARTKVMNGEGEYKGTDSGDWEVYDVIEIGEIVNSEVKQDE